MLAGMAIGLGYAAGKTKPARGGLVSGVGVGLLLLDLGQALPDGVSGLDQVPLVKRAQSCFQGLKGDPQGYLRGKFWEDCLLVLAH